MNLFDDIRKQAIDAVNSVAPAYSISIEQQEADQKTYEWFRARMGCFNASEIPKLMTQGRGKGELWGATSMGIIDKVVVERSMTEEGIEMYIKELMYKEYQQTNWGNKYESQALEVLSDRMQTNDIETVGSVKHPEIKYFRGSADGIISGTPIEIKCPYDPMKHQANLRLLKTGITEKHEYYGQMQSHIMIHDSSMCFFASYDPRRKSPDDLAVFSVNRDEAYVNALRSRLEEAEEMVRDFLLIN